MARQRPIAGQRARPRLGTDRPDVPDEPDVPDGPGTADGPGAPDVPASADTPDMGDETHPDPVPGRVRADSLLLLALALVGVLVFVLAATAGLLVLHGRADDRVEQARGQARAAAESHAVRLLSYDHRHLDRDFAQAKDVLTGGFADDYASTTEEVVRPTALEVKAVVTAEVASSSVVRASEDRAVILLFVDQTTTSTRLDGPRVDLNRVRMTLDRSSGRWLVSGVDAL